MLSVLFLTQEVTSGLFIAKTRKPHPLSLTGDAGEPLAGFLIGYLSKQNPSKFQCSQPLSVYRKKSSKMHRKIENQRQTITLEKTDLSVSYSRVFPSQHQCRTAGVAVSEAGADRRGSWAPTVSARRNRRAGRRASPTDKRTGPAFLRRADVSTDEPLHTLLLGRWLRARTWRQQRVPRSTKGCT